MQHHTAQQIGNGPRASKWVYTGGGQHHRLVECCSEAWLEMLQSEDMDASPAWERIGHDTQDEAYAHMRAVLLDQLNTERTLADWAGCRAPVHDTICGLPTKGCADIPPTYFSEPLCDDHRNRHTVEAMWDGPGDWTGSW